MEDRQVGTAFTNLALYYGLSMWTGWSTEASFTGLNPTVSTKHFVHLSLYFWEAGYTRW